MLKYGRQITLMNKSKQNEFSNINTNKAGGEHIKKHIDPHFQ